jgi:hypothetical protein
MRNNRLKLRVCISEVQPPTTFQKNDLTYNFQKIVGQYELGDHTNVCVFSFPTHLINSVKVGDTAVIWFSIEAKQHRETQEYYNTVLYASKVHNLRKNMVFHKVLRPRPKAIDLEIEDHS